MKKITHLASTNFLGILVLLGFLCTPMLPANFDGLSDLFHSIQQQWQSLTEWMKRAEWDAGPSHPMVKL